VNPGPGLWSSKLHDFLSPRTHFLLEPEDSFYMPFLQPLLDRQGSKYRHVTQPAEVITTYSKLAEENFPRNTPLASSSNNVPPSSNSNALLLNVQGGTTSTTASGIQLSLARTIVYQVLDSIARRELFTSYDLVRIFFWVNDSEKHQHVPRHLIHRRAQTIRLEAVCDATIEVAGGEAVVGPLRRDAQLDELSAAHTLERMRLNNMKRPENRQDPASQQNPEEMDTADDQGNETIKRPFYNELALLESQYKNGEFSPFVKEPTTKGSNLRSRVRTRRYQRLLDLRNQRHTEAKLAQTVDPIIERYDCIVSLREEILSLKPGDPLAGSLQEESKALKEEYDSMIERISDRERKRVQLRLDERRALGTDPPLLQWDRREYEPLVVNASDFLPQVIHYHSILYMQLTSDVSET
jgi:transcription factor 1